MGGGGGGDIRVTLPSPHPSYMSLLITVTTCVFMLRYPLRMCVCACVSYTKQIVFENGGRETTARGREGGDGREEEGEIGEERHSRASNRMKDCEREKRRRRSFTVLRLCHPYGSPRTVPVLPFVILSSSLPIFLSPSPLPLHRSLSLSL